MGALLIGCSTAFNILYMEADGAECDKAMHYADSSQPCTLALDNNIETHSESA